MELSENSKIRLTLTKRGADWYNYERERINAYARLVGGTVLNEGRKCAEGDVIDMWVWEMMQVFGESYSEDTSRLFSHMEIVEQ